MILDDCPNDAIEAFKFWMRSLERDSFQVVGLFSDGPQFKPSVDVPPIEVVEAFLAREHPEYKKYKDLLIKAAENERQNSPIPMDKERWETVMKTPNKDQS